MPHQPLLRPYWENRSHLTVVDDILLYDARLVIPRSMRRQILDCIHTGHLGLTKCRSRARISVWWPGLYTQIGDLISRCVTCAKEQPMLREPLMPSSFPSRPWERIATDLYDFNGTKYIIVVDYYSRWFEIKELSDETSHAAIKALKGDFCYTWHPRCHNARQRATVQLQRPSDTLQKHIISHMLQVHQGTLK